jgi:hypothetical protein
MWGEKGEGTMTPQKANNNIIEDLMEREGNESPDAHLKRIMIRKFNKIEEELKENMQNIL